jgi:hypothetical protein
MSDSGYEYVGSRDPFEGETPDDEAEIVFVWYDHNVKQYMEIYASSKGTQWGQPVHILKSNIAILTDWLINVNLDEDEGGEDESKQYFD